MTANFIFNGEFVKSEQKENITTKGTFLSTVLVLWDIKRKREVLFELYGHPHLDFQKTDPVLLTGKHYVTFYNEYKNIRFFMSNIDNGIPKGEPNSEINLATFSGRVQQFNDKIIGDKNIVEAVIRDDSVKIKDKSYEEYFAIFTEEQFREFRSMGTYIAVRGHYQTKWIETQAGKNYNIKEIIADAVRGLDRGQAKAEESNAPPPAPANIPTPLEGDGEIPF